MNESLVHTQYGVGWGEGGPGRSGVQTREDQGKTELSLRKKLLMELKS